jgi:hypothetical protein
VAGLTRERGMKYRSAGWLVDPGHVPEEQPPRGVHIGMSDVERFRVTVEMFTKLDDRYSDAIGRELFTAVGEATLLAAWMSYDSAPASALAQGYFVQALALAQAGHDRLLGASILDAR